MSANDKEVVLLTDGQKKVVGFTLGLLAFLTSIALLVVIILVCLRLIGYFSNVLWPLAVAGILALMLRPLVELLEERLKMSRIWAVSLLFALFLSLVVGMVIALTPLLVKQILDLIDYGPRLWADVLRYIELHYPQWVAIGREQMNNPAVRQAVDSVVSGAKEIASHTLPTLRSAGSGLLSAFNFLAGVAIIPIYLFFFMMSKREPTQNLGNHLVFLRDNLRSDVVFLVREFVGILVSFFRGQLLIGMIMGVLLAIGFTIAGLKFGIVLGLIAGLLNIVPYLGTIIGLGTALPLAFIQEGGGLPLVAICLGIFIAVQIVEGYYLTPRIMGRQTGLHPVTIIVAVFFWGTALQGILGMILAIPLTAFFVTAWRLVKFKYFRPAPKAVPLP